MQRKWRRDWERGKTQRNPLKNLAKSILPPVAAAGLLLGSMTGTYANPTNGQITTGAGTITENGSTMTINQTSDKLGINWQSFNIGSGETVQFIQPGSNAIALNRVLGNDASGIYGSLIANGKVFLINPNGVLFAPGASVNVGSIVASTLNISDSDFLAGNYTFTGGDGGSVVNQGTITVTNGGYAALLAPDVINEGLIVAQQGTVALGAGKAVTLNLEGDGLLNLAVDEAALNANAANHNLIQADGGRVIMAARAADELVGTVVNNSGMIRAQSYNEVNGDIYLDGGTAGTVVNSGTMDASGKAAGQTGGTVKVLGNAVTLADGAKVDVSGDAGGGTALIGGNYQGKGTEQNATNTTVAQTATINADAITSGNGGKVVVWADDTTNFHGNISAKGGAAGGDGGQVEVSGKQSLTYKGHTDTTAAMGRTGSLLLDPGEYTISTGATGDNIKNADELGTELASNNITLQTDGTGTGDITVAAPVSWSAGTTLSLIANNSISINANITVSGSNAGLALTTATGGYTLGSGAKITLSGSDAAFSLNGTAYTVINDHSTGGALQALQAINTDSTTLAGRYFLGSDIDASATSNWNGGAGWTAIGTTTSKFTGIFDGGGHVISGLTIDMPSNSIGGLFGYADHATLRNVGLENVKITGSFSRVGALAADINACTIANSYSTGSITTTEYNSTAGGLVGRSDYNNTAGGITNSYSTVNVRGENMESGSFGGLIGNATRDNISNCYSTGTVTLSDISSTGSLNIGGLVGYNGTNTSLTNSYSTGAVSLINAAGYTGKAYVGGLAGVSTGTISNSYTTSSVTVNGGASTSRIGGLVGRTIKPINNCYSTGLVINNGTGVAGGFAGEAAAGNITNSYWDTQTSGISDTTKGVGTIASYAGVYGKTTAELMNSGTYADTWNFGEGGTWFMIDGYTRPFLRLEYSTNITNGHQLQLMAMDPTAAYTLTNNIDLSGMFTDAAGMWNTATGFVPVGSETTAFSGTLDGGGHTIRGLTINSPGAPYSALGLFGYTMTGADIHDIGLIDAHITGGAANPYVGSLVGYNGVGSTVTNAYSYSTGTGAVSGTGSVGGLAGANAGTIQYTYSATPVSGGIAGGLVGDGTGGIIIDSVWDTDVSGRSDGVGNGAGTNSVSGMTTTQMEDRTQYPTSWNFSTTWVLSGARPHLVREYNGALFISSLSDLLSFLQSSGTNLSGTYILGASITDIGSWTPVGTDTTPFTGSFIGNGYSLSGLTISSTSPYAGLFGYTQGATISGVNLVDVNITAGVGSLYVGSLVGYSGAGTNISNCSSAGLVTAGGSGSTAGGLVGYNAGSIANAYNAATVTSDGGNNTVGGLTGQNDGGISDSYNTGTVSTTVNGTHNVAGGLAGINNGSLTGAYNAGTVALQGAQSIAGGLLGISNSSITALYNTGTVTSDADNNAIGGLAGENNSTISNSYSKAVVSATANAANNNVGGLAGTNTAVGVITGSYVAGSTVTAQGAGSAVGGLAGKNAGNITDSYSMAVTKGTGDNSKVGGLTGENTGNIDYAFSVGATIGTGSGSNVGGLVGLNNGSISNALWATDTSGQQNGVGPGSASAAGVQGLTFANLLQSANYTGWNTAAWGIADGFLPYLKWQYSGTPTSVFTGTVEGEAAGRTVNVFFNGRQVAQAYEFGINGEYYGASTPIQEMVNNGSPVLLCVAGDPAYKANGIYLTNGNGVTGGKLLQNTLIIDGGSSTVPFASWGDVLVNNYTSWTSPDILLSFDGMLYSVTGDVQATNISLKDYSLHATGSITIDNPGDFIMNSPTYIGEMRNQQISADGDITITTGGNFVLRHGTPDGSVYYNGSTTYIFQSPRSAYTQLIAGGDIIIRAGGAFVNHSGPEAIQLTGGGRWLIYAPNNLIYASDVDLFYQQSLYANNYGAATGGRNGVPDVNYYNSPGQRSLAELAPHSPDLAYDVTGGLTYDFVSWAGETVPATGSGFIFGSINPAIRPLSTSQSQRRAAMIAAQSGHDQTGNSQGLPIVVGSSSGTPADNDNLPFLTIVDEGVNLE